MKQMYIIVLLVFAMVVGCTMNQKEAALSGASVASGVYAADQLLQSGEVESVVMSIEYSDADRTVLVGAMNDYAISREVLSELTQSPEAALFIQTTIQAEHTRLVEAYKRVFEVINLNFDKYDPVAQAKLKRWKAQSERIEIQYQNFIAALNTEIGQDIRYQRILEVLKLVSQFALMVV